jgi:hypothetical protein
MREKLASTTWITHRMQNWDLREPRGRKLAYG